jgi:uncharacterized protein YijF (DUF1287 family)
MKKIFLFLTVSLLTVNLFSQNLKLADAAWSIIDSWIIYDASYVEIPYPNGDISPKKGVCTDVIIRAYRKIGIDLQKEVHEDMKANFSKYPKRWKRTEPDPNIDHRRVLNLMKFFERNGDVLKITDNPKDYKPGDIVCWELMTGVYHIGIVSNVRYANSEGLPEDRLLIVHQIGFGQIPEDVLFNWKIIGHYVYP